jgi:hypothetical protein
MLTRCLITPDDLAILHAGTGATPVTSPPGRAVTRPRLAAEPFY